jgi:hemerythrin
MTRRAAVLSVSEHNRTKGSAPHEMIEVIQKWQREHMMTSDKHYADYFSRLASKKVA